jgi:hypothetical protein
MIRPLRMPRCDATKRIGRNGVANIGGHGRDVHESRPARMGGTMAARKKKTARKKTGGGDLIISKARTKAAVKKCNVGSEFYDALDKAVRKAITEAEARAIGNKRKTLKAVDL